MRCDPRRENNLLISRRDNIQNFVDVWKCERPYHWLNTPWQAWKNAGPFRQRTCKLVNDVNGAHQDRVFHTQHVTELKRRKNTCAGYVLNAVFAFVFIPSTLKFMKCNMQRWNSVLASFLALSLSLKHDLNRWQLTVRCKKLRQTQTFPLCSKL